MIATETVAAARLVRLVRTGRGRDALRLALRTQVGRFAAIGVASTLAYAVIYLVLRRVAGPGTANAAALALTAVANTQANRRLTFGVRGRDGLLRQHLQGGGVFVLTLALTSLALSAQQGLAPRAPRLVELAVLVSASIGATVVRFVALRGWVFARGSRESGERPVTTAPPST